MTALSAILPGAGALRRNALHVSCACCSVILTRSYLSNLCRAPMRISLLIVNQSLSDCQAEFHASTIPLAIDGITVQSVLPGSATSQPVEKIRTGHSHENMQPVAEPASIGYFSLLTDTRSRCCEVSIYTRQTRVSYDSATRLTARLRRSEAAWAYAARISASRAQPGVARLMLSTGQPRCYILAFGCLVHQRRRHWTTRLLRWTSC